ncbi:GDSL-type esterase/lipase family protein [Ruminococcus sp. 5_1_39BFAA]|uniref:GDSL-type esterase/lipase family protein n=1 Tax=Ruminococcus sp. 5_1_39BFAA TaxID=457412 RepID=UPI003568AAD2
MKKHIVCFGDSNTYGYNAATNGRFDEETRWTCLLQEMLGDEYVVREEGLGGRTTCFRDPLTEGMSGLDYLYPCLMSHGPLDLLVIMLGTNDTKERFGCTPECIGQSLKRLISKAISTVDCWEKGRANILVVTPQNIDRRYAQTEIAGIMGYGCAEKSEGLSAEFKKIADLMGCHYLDANEAISAPTNDVDYMHLTAEGHRQLAEALAAKIPEIV